MVTLLCNEMSPLIYPVYNDNFSVCDIATFGDNCSDVCACLNGTCDPVNGACADGKCQDGWHGPTCSLGTYHTKCPSFVIYYTFR